MNVQKFGRKWRKPLRIEKKNNERMRSQNSKLFEEWKKFILLVQSIKNIQKHRKMQEENWKGLWLQQCRVTEKSSDIQASGNWKRSHKWAMAKNSNQCMDVWWNPMNPQGNEQNLRNRKIMKIALLGKDLLRWRITIWCASSSRYRQQWRFQMQKLPWRRNGRSSKRWRSSKRFQPGSWTQLWAKRRLFWKHTETNRKSTLLHWWTMSPQKRGVRTKITEVQRQCRAPGGHCKRRLWSQCSIHWTRLVCVSDDCCKDHGRCCKITRLCEGQAADAVSAHTRVKLEDALE